MSILAFVIIISKLKATAEIYETVRQIDVLLRKTLGSLLERRRNPAIREPLDPLNPLVSYTKTE